ncbi:hypothetical protein L1887_05499 [Cichorium endivia]|nr:hypothetical protein L1887_05499 [Cichorium endivia]
MNLVPSPVNLKMSPSTDESAIVSGLSTVTIVRSQKHPILKRNWADLSKIDPLQVSSPLPLCSFILYRLDMLWLINSPLF